MATMTFIATLTFYTSLFFQIVVAIPGATPWLGPIPTPMSLMATAGMSPRPTEAPGSNGIPRELRRRQNQYQYPPPPNWCGFVDSLYDHPLSCSVGLTCANSGTALGCCTATTGLCTALYTTCANYLDQCDEACLTNPAIRKCDILNPYCGTFSFPGDTYLFNCMVTYALIQTVEFLNDFYVTAIGSTLASEPTTNPFGFTASASLAAYSSTPGLPTTLSTAAFGSTVPTSTNIVAPLPSTRNGLPIVAIDGIIAAGAIVGVLIFAAIVFFCIRARRKQEIEAAKRPPAYRQPPPMQWQAQQLQAQQPQQPAVKAFSGYQSVPQQEQQPRVTELPLSFPPTPELPSPQAQPQTAFLTPSSSFSAPTPHPLGSPDPRFSSGSTTLLSPMSPGSDPRQIHYKFPISPNISEKDATLGNPSVPVDAAHGVPTEVDATMGNPGVPVNAAHGVPVEVDGTPNAVELDGIRNWAGGGAMSPGRGT